MEIRLSKNIKGVSLDELREHLEPILAKLDSAKFISFETMAKYAAAKRPIQHGVLAPSLF